MKVHEYQAKAVLARFGVPVPRGEVGFSAARAGEQVADERVTLYSDPADRDLRALPFDVWDPCLLVRATETPQPNKGVRGPGSGV